MAEVSDLLRDVTAELLARAVHASGSGIVIADATDPELPLTFVNPAFEAMTGYSARECLGRNCRFLQGRDTDPAAVAELADAIAVGRDTRVVLLNNRKDGTPFFNELRLSAIRSRDGETTQFIGVQNDVSGLVQVQRTLEHQHERTVADLHAFQAALTPPGLPIRPGLELATASVPAEFGVGGDFQLVTKGPGESTVLVVGDAMGHGISAARRATFVRTAMAAFAPFCDDPQRLLEMTNQAFVEHAGTSAEFVTASCAIYQPRARQLRWASAGHPVPLRLDDGTPVGPSGHVSVALGINATTLSGSCGEARLAAGTGILLYSDGLPEARSADRRKGPTLRLGELRVQEVLREHAGQDPSQVVDGLVTAVDAHTRGAAADDLCLLAARTT